MNKNLEKLYDINKEIEELRGLKEEVEREYLEEICPFKIGETVEVKGWSYSGKKMAIDDRYIKESYSGKFYWIVVGFIIKKDGSLSKTQRGEVSKLNHLKTRPS